MSKTILITGASSGFGRDTAETLALEGHRVFATLRDIDGRNRTHADALRAKGIHVEQLDVTSDVSVAQGVKAVLAQAGRLDVVINNAGTAVLDVSEAFTTNQVRDLYEVNVFGVHRVLRATLPTLRKQGEGLIINIGSSLGRVTGPFYGLYGSSKFAIEALSDTFRYEISPFGVDLVLVQPSAYPTSMLDSAARPADKECIASYGEIANIPGKIIKARAASIQGENARSPHEVAVAIADLVRKPQGTRPPRVVVGKSIGVEDLNRASQAAQARFLGAFGLGFLDKSQSAPGA
jgi:NAD(P)-dependent dehydrogenase (short-subunit alcohol dehydrogenase family)